MTQPSQLKVFVNYRRADERLFVELLRTHFMFRYGRENVFMDFDSIPAFAQFEEFIKQKVREADVVAMIIGKRWLELRREKESSGDVDYVMLELEEAIRLNKVIAPICIQGAEMPDLPDALRSIGTRNAAFVSDGQNILDNITRIMNGFEAELARHGAKREIANPESQTTIDETQDSAGELDIDTVLGRYAEAAQADDLPQALVWLAQLRLVGAQLIPPAFDLDGREARLQEELREQEDHRRRREVADFQYKFIRIMLKDRYSSPERIKEAVEEIWRVDAGYVPDELADTINQLMGVKPLRTTPTSLELMPKPFAWVPIPAGKVSLVNTWDGDENVYLKKNKPQTFDVPTFAIAKYPVTNAQFAKFVAAGGYDNSSWWTDAGWVTRQNEKWTEPRYWEDSKWNKADHPVVGVSWYEAIAFCLWLSETTGENITLPTEQEWQRVVQDDDGRAYPWGKEWDGKRCNNNVDRKGIGATTPVTEYEGKDKGDSPYGVTDMSGNVWEWCLTVYSSGETGLNGTDVRVLRGGSWVNGSADNFRAVYRYGYYPSLRSYDVGFRVVSS